MNLNKVAKAYIEKGLSVIPVDNKKCPLIHSWYEFQKRKMTNEEVDRYFKDAWGIAICCGEVSGGGDGESLIVIDIDTKNFDEHITYEEICEAVPPEIFNKFLISKTMNGGYHWYLRAPISGRNQKYAMRPTTEEERKDNPKELMRVTIENRGNGGYVLAWPSVGYTIISENKKIPNLSLDEYYALTDVLGSFNRVINEGQLYAQFAVEKANKFLQSPFDDFNKRESILNILLRNGYSVVGNNVGDKVKVKRSGNSLSPHSGYVMPDNRYVNFSTSTEFESSKSYSCSELFTILECKNDWGECYKRLIADGYGHSVNMSSEVREFTKAFRAGDLMKLLQIHFGAEKVKEGVKINDRVFNITI